MKSLHYAQEQVTTILEEIALTEKRVAGTSEAQRLFRPKPSHLFRPKPGHPINPQARILYSE